MRKAQLVYNHLLADLLGVINDESCKSLTGPSLETVPMEKNVNLKKGRGSKNGPAILNLYYYDKCLAMGCSSACQIFERFSTALEWIGKRHIPERVIIHILDHFLIMTQTV
jgi:hypothetical protein